MVVWTGALIWHFHTKGDWRIAFPAHVSSCTAATSNKQSDRVAHLSALQVLPARLQTTAAAFCSFWLWETIMTDHELNSEVLHHCNIISFPHACAHFLGVILPCTARTAWSGLSGPRPGGVWAWSGSARARGRPCSARCPWGGYRNGCSWSSHSERPVPESCGGGERGGRQRVTD